VRRVDAFAVPARERGRLQLLPGIAEALLERGMLARQVE
jgi:hypothetical protein